MVIGFVKRSRRFSVNSVYVADMSLLTTCMFNVTVTFYDLYILCNCFLFWDCWLCTKCVVAHILSLFPLPPKFSKRHVEVINQLNWLLLGAWLIAIKQFIRGYIYTFTCMSSTMWWNVVMSLLGICNSIIRIHLLHIVQLSL